MPDILVAQKSVSNVSCDEKKARKAREIDMPDFVGWYAESAIKRETRMLDGSTQLLTWAQSGYFAQGVLLYMNEETDFIEWHGEHPMNSDVYILWYFGVFRDGKPNGRGKAIFRNGDAYEGEFINGNPHGSGTLKSINGDEYVGNWIEGRKTGYGKEITYSGGEEYVGAWKDNKRHGFGKLIRKAYGTRRKEKERLKT